jgi:hypothetical protein
MVSGYEELRGLEIGAAIVAASDHLLALHKIDEPSREQRLAAMLDAEFKLRVIGALTRRR